MRGRKECPDFLSVIHKGQREGMHHRVLRGLRITGLLRARPAGLRKDVALKQKDINADCDCVRGWDFPTAVQAPARGRARQYNTGRSEAHARVLTFPVPWLPRHLCAFWEWVP